MKRIVIWSGTCVLGLALLAYAAGEKLEVFEGEVSDTPCAMNVHSLTRSHREMLKNKAHGTTPADCVRYCVRYEGGHFVLYSKNKLYRLDNEDTVLDFPAQKVRITGTYDKDRNTIHVLKVEPL